MGASRAARRRPRGAERGARARAAQVRLELAGLPVILLDTAGLRRAPADEVEAEGIRRATDATRRAHLTLFVLDASSATEAVDGRTESRGLERAREALQQLGDSRGAAREDGAGGPPLPFSPGGDGGLVFVANKIDAIAPARAAGAPTDAVARALLSQLEREYLESTSSGGAGGGDGGDEPARARHAISCETGEGIDELIAALEARIVSEFETGSLRDSEPPVITRARHRRHVERCSAALDAFLHDDLVTELRVEELRTASLELGRVVGAIDVEEVLDVLFRDFCIGK